MGSTVVDTQAPISILPGLATPARGARCWGDGSMMGNDDELLVFSSLSFFLPFFPAVLAAVVVETPWIIMDRPPTSLPSLPLRLH